MRHVHSHLCITNEIYESSFQMLEIMTFKIVKSLIGCQRSTADQYSSNTMTCLSERQL